MASSAGPPPPPGSAPPKGALARFASFASFVDVKFWQALEAKKLDELKLSAVPCAAHGVYAAAEGGAACQLLFDERSFEEHRESPRSEATVPGEVIVVNSIKDFKALDKNQILREAGEQLLGDMRSGTSLERPELLNRFVLIAFVNLKTHEFIYWFGFPALTLPAPATVPDSPPRPVADVFHPEALPVLVDGISHLGAPQYFLVRLDGDRQPSDVLPLAALDQFSGSEDDQLCFGFLDPCTMPEHPGWPLRNLLALLALRLDTADGPRRISILSLRRVPRPGDDVSGDPTSLGQVFDMILHPGSAPDGNVTGWEPNQRGKNGPRKVDLSGIMDPVKLAASSMDLNLKLMRWRALPELDTAALADTRVLLLGAGTLGCNVARNLLGWGVRRITLVDNGVVSFSNPTRQSLFEFSDCVGGGTPKARAAAKALERIFPGVEARSLQLSIPMPGHSVETDLDAARRAVETLHDEINQHDVVFLLTDTRESRWLPTMIATLLDKTMINVALGIDSFLVARHGGSPLEPRASEERLGCYFCNDVVGPRDSTQDRTIDQQCTVTRPGLAPVAAGIAVELAVSLLQHPDRHWAEADVSIPVMEERREGTTPLGCLPHQIRGYLPTFGMVHPKAKCFPQCSACSVNVCLEYQQKGFTFIEEVCADAQVLEQVSGLTEFRAQTEKLLSDLDGELEGFEDDF